VNCFVCKGPYHPATGGLFGHQNTPFCGACVRECIKFLKEWTPRKSGGVRFYQHATLPPPGGARSLAADFQKALSNAKHPVSHEVALATACAHITVSKEEAASILMSAGVPITVRKGGKFGAGGTPCTVWEVNGNNLMMG
jgi:hypothetical protein